MKKKNNTGFTRHRNAAVSRLEAENKALRAEVERLRAGHTCREGDRVDCPACDTYLRTAYLPPPPTREEVERAVDAFGDAVVRWYEAVQSATDEAPEETKAAKAARAALVALATRGNTPPAPPPSSGKPDPGCLY